MTRITEYASIMRANVVRIIDRKDAKCVTLTGRIVILSKGEDWCGLNAGDMVEIQKYDRHSSLFSEWLVVEPEVYTPPVPKPAYRATLSAEPVRPPMPDPKKIRDERFAVAPTHVSYRDLEAEREELRRMSRGR